MLLNLHYIIYTVDTDPADGLGDQYMPITTMQHNKLDRQTDRQTYKQTEGQQVIVIPVDDYHTDFVVADDLHNTPTSTLSNIIFLF